MVLVLLGSLLGGCDRKRPSAAEKEPHRVTATIYPLADVAKSIGDHRVEVKWFIESGQSLEDVPSGVAERLNVSDIVLARGTVDQWALGLQSPEAYQATRFIRLDTLPETSGAVGYTWLDPQVIRAFAAVLRDRLIEKDVEQDLDSAAFFQENAAAFVREVEALIEEFQPRLAALKSRKFLCTDPDFAPLAKACDLEVISVILASTPRLSDRQIVDLRNAAQAEGVKTLFVRADQPPAVQRDLAGRTGLTVLTLDPLGSSAPSSGRSTYVQLLRYNLEQVVAGLTQ